MCIPAVVGRSATVRGDVMRASGTAADVAEAAALATSIVAAEGSVPAAAEGSVPAMGWTAASVGAAVATMACPVMDGDGAPRP